MDDFEGEIYRHGCVQAYLIQSNATVAADVYLWGRDGEVGGEQGVQFSVF